ncbi:alpha/beta fold hydrolase [Altibacter sp.]|uniref:alpha/beta hydrolase n=1 Tax=Altibacter sp. TaxID=2024823 RepID=UPI000C95B0FF|nr:alpha/beta fold hydrolase [Altibacter sp.]MAP54838.1 alpha/beta hydrolase [Altibacter sp.]
MGYLKKTLIVVLSVVVLSLTLLYAMQTKLLFHPTKLSEDYTYTFSAPFEELFMETTDGARLNALHFKATAPKGIILYFHGNAGDLSRWGAITTYFLPFGYDVLVMDYRTYGKSTGKLSEETLYEDAQLWYEHLLKQWTEDAIVVYGRSLGTTLGTYVAAKNSPKQLILETPFYSMTDVAQRRFPILPIKYLLKFNFPTYSFAGKIECPILILHGTNDAVVPYASAKDLELQFPEALVSFVTIAQGAHNNLVEFAEYHAAIAEVLN